MSIARMKQEFLWRHEYRTPSRGSAVAGDRSHILHPLSIATSVTVILSFLREIHFQQPAA